MPITSQPLADQALVERVLRCMESCEDNHKRWRRKANHHFALYNNFNDFRAALHDARPRGADDVWHQAQSTWGSELFVPACFATVEATLPLVLANRPRLLGTPRNMASDGNVGNVQTILEAQLEEMRYGLTLEEVVKTALIYGLGVQRTYWDTRYRKRSRLVQSEQPMSANPTGYSQATTLEVTYDDPRVEAIDPFDFFWDPHAKDIDTCAYVVERQWRSMDWIARKFMAGEWRNGADLELVAGMGGEVRYSEAWNERLKALGYSQVVNRGPHRPHEILRYHNGEEFVEVMDRELCVNSGENPDWHGEIPYDIYRPTQIPGRFEGKGLIEPIEGLQQEINELRRDRRDNARLIINKCFAFTAGMVDTDDFKFGPGLGIPVDGDPRELLMPIQMGDIPYAGYQEEQALQGDLKFTSGISDADQGAQAPQQTATGAQLVYSATSRRAALMTRRAESELITAAAHKVTGLNQQHILANRDVQIPSPPTPGQPDRRWTWVSLGPADLAGDYSWSIEGTTGAENTPQERSEGTQLWTMFAENKNVDQQRLVAEIFKKYGYRDPSVFLAPPEARPPAAVLSLIVEGLIRNFQIPPDQAQALVGQALQMAVSEEQEGTTSGDVPPPPPEPEAAQPSTNGAPA